MQIIGFEDRTYPFSLSFRHFNFLKDGKIFSHQPLLNFVRGNSESNFERDFILR